MVYITISTWLVPTQVPEQNYLYFISDISKIKNYFFSIFAVMLLNQMILHLCFLYYKQQLLQSNPNV